ncbi:OmpA family protein [Zobellella maritima]|uniref:OmpA family protein n=1 Tax=Zobellella maritima TaxID=2059725 RepID=UPI000E2FF4E9|nr:OmpA family protein [Zobellella maritima]
MKSWILMLLLLPLVGCSLTAEPERETVAAFDLTDPDWDGVVNAREQCGDSPSGAEVDNVGCHQGSTQELKQDLLVLFDHDSSAIKPEYRTAINDMAGFMTKTPEKLLLIEGHASKVGSEEYNLALSKRRAEAVRAALIKGGISGDRLDIIGFGESKPLIMVDNEEDEESAAANRRVVGALADSREGTRMRWTVYSMEE